MKRRSTDGAREDGSGTGRHRSLHSARLAAALAGALLLALPAEAVADPGSCARPSSEGAAGGCCREGTNPGCARVGSMTPRGSSGRRAEGPEGLADDRETFHFLLQNHEKISRTVEEIDDGVLTTTTSEDPGIAEGIRAHVRQMEQRMESGAGLRHWDPLFVEIFESHDRVKIEIEDVPGGVRVRETSDDPRVVGLIRQHANRAVSEFVQEGFPRAHRPTPLPGESEAAIEGE